MSRILFRLLPALLAPAGCQRYEPRPLYPGAHQSEWAARDPASQHVVDYARSLEASSDPPPPRYDPADGISLPEAEVIALFFNPQLRVARLKARIPAAGAQHAGRWDDPELAVDAERILESVQDPWVIGGMINITLPLSGRLGAERRLAGAQAEAEAMRARLQEHRVLAELRKGWVRWSSTRLRAELTDRYLKDLEQIAQRAEKLREAGELDRLDARLFAIERLTRAGELRVLENGQREQELEGRRLMGLTPEAELTLTPAVTLDAGQVIEPARRAEVVAAHPRVRLVHAEYDVAERTLAAEVRKQYPDLTLGGGPGSDEGDSRALFGLNLPLPLLNANRRAIAEAHAARDAARAEAHAAVEELTFDLARAQAALAAARARRRHVEQELAPLVDQQVDEARRLGRLGDFNTLVLLESLRRSHETKLLAIEAALQEGTAAAELISLTRPQPAPPTTETRP